MEKGGGSHPEGVWTWTMTATVTFIQHLAATCYLRSQETGLGQRLSSNDWLQSNYK